MSKAEEDFLFQIKAYKLPLPSREYLFHPKRKWRFDFAWPQLLLAVEVDGLTRKGGGHQTYGGYTNDREKDGAALVESLWCIYRCTTEMVRKGDAIKTFEIIYNLRKEQMLLIDIGRIGRDSMRDSYRIYRERIYGEIEEGEKSCSG